ncbi:MAG: ATP-grasp domain-containing protein [Pseudomonadota bacterium]
MTSPKIALFADKDSPQILEIRDAVATEGGSPVVLDIQLGGQSAPALSIDPTRLLWDGVDFSEISAIHIRCTAPNTLPSLPPVMNRAMYSEIRLKTLREQEYQSAIYSFFEEFQARGGLVVNPLTGGYIDHDTKTQLYEKLRARGFVVPGCLTTNSPEKAEEFIRSLEEVVFKPAVGVGSTRIVTDHDLQNLSLLKLCPVIFQERIKGETLRLHVVGDRVVLALKIVAPGIDSRTRTEKFEYAKLPGEEERRIVRAHRFLGLHYSAWDVVAAEDGRYVCLDCNSGPYVMWIGPEFRKHVFKQLAAYLVTWALTGSTAKASERVASWKG